MNVQFFIAGILASMLTIGHGFISEYFIIRRLQTTHLPHTPFGKDSEITKKALRISVHIVSIDFFLSAVTLFVLTFTDLVENPEILARFISLHFVGYALVFLIAGISLGLGVLPFILIVAIAILAWWGTL